MELTSGLFIVFADMIFWGLLSGCLGYGLTCLMGVSKGNYPLGIEGIVFWV